MVSIFCAFGEGLIFDKAQLGREFHRDQVAHLAAQKALVPVQRRDDRLGVLAAQRFAEDRGIAHVGRGLDLGDGHRHAVEIGIADVAAAQNFGQRMAQRLADAQLALRRTFWTAKVSGALFL